MASLDELVEKQKAYTVMVAACGATGHDFSVSGPFSAEVGKSCSKCDIAELPWLRGEVVRLTEHADAFTAGAVRGAEAVAEWLEGAQWDDAGQPCPSDALLVVEEREAEKLARMVRKRFAGGRRPAATWSG